MELYKYGRYLFGKISLMVIKKKSRHINCA